MTDLKFMASDGNMYPAEWFGQWQSFEERQPPEAEHRHVHWKGYEYWTLIPREPKTKKIYDKYLDTHGEFDFKYFSKVFYSKTEIFKNPDEGRALIAFIQDNLPKE